jgi:cytoskeletal protein CcmA (bactofilin family)
MFGGKPRADGSSGMTLIAEEAFFHGTLAAKGSLRVEGSFEGDIADAVDVEVGAKGRIRGNVAAETVVVAGEIVGNVVAAGFVELLSTARLTGDLRAQRIKIDEGAFFEGVCAMGAEDRPRRRRGKSEPETERAPEPGEPVT